MNAIEVLLQHIGSLVDGGHVPLEEMARYLGTSPATLRELIDGKIKPSPAIVREIEALNATLLRDPKTAFLARVNAGLERDQSPRGRVKVLPLNRRDSSGR